MAIAPSRRPELQPTTIERASPGQMHGDLAPLPALDAILRSVFRMVEGARGLLVTDAPEGAVVYLIVDDRDVEDHAYEVFARAAGLYGDHPPTFIAVPRDEADAVMVSPGARAYALP